jgi:hypothetical protein
MSRLPIGWAFALFYRGFLAGSLVQEYIPGYLGSGWGGGTAGGDGGQVAAGWCGGDLAGLIKRGRAERLAQGGEREAGN